MQEVLATIITIGDELLIGQTVDTNSAYIGKALNRIGIWVHRRVAIGDVSEEILNTLETESKRGQLIIITGGLGPTADDITKPALCTYFKSKLVVSEAALQNVKDIFARLNKPLIERNIKQAEVPENCTVLPNKRGTAPGMWFDHQGVVYVSLPGVPHEMKGLMEHEVLPRLQQQFILPAIVHRTAFTTGKGESEIAEMIAPFEKELPPHIKLAYLPSFGSVKLRLTGKGPEMESLKKEVDDHFRQMTTIVSDFLVGTEDMTMVEAVFHLLTERKKTVTTAESCTGGYIAHLITSKAGSSRIYSGSVVSYANEAKELFLGVRKETLKDYGAVSEATVLEMAKGARERMKTDYAIATSGIMGPDGGTEEKPVGTVWMAVSGKQSARAQKFFFRYDRKHNIELAAHAALNLLRRFILEENLT